jgi:peroxiredoxin Q/BCP
MAQYPGPGDKAPAFRLTADDGSVVTLSDFRGRKLVLYFYPRADTPGCTRESLDFNRLRTEFAAAETAILGVSADSVKAQANFKTKHGIVLPLASDPGHDMLSAYGVWGEKKLYGRTFHGITRSTFLIEGNGRIARAWRNVKVPEHAEEVLAAARAS